MTELDERMAKAFADLRAGLPVLVADDAGREGEVDIVLAAGVATERWIGWTVRHSSGFLCAPMSAQRADLLGLPLMVTENRDPFRTQYTVSVDAATGVGTGISAADRAATCRVLADPMATRDSLIRPGHVLPLRAHPGGVSERPGHTEAALDLVLAAGAGEVAVIAEVVEDSGRVSTFEEARALAESADLVFLAVGEIVQWRRTQS